MTNYVVEVVKIMLEDGTELPVRDVFDNKQKALETYSRIYIELDFGIIRLFEVINDQKVLIKEDTADLFIFDASGFKFED